VGGKRKGGGEASALEKGQALAPAWKRSTISVIPERKKKKKGGEEVTRRRTPSCLGLCGNGGREGKKKESDTTELNIGRRGGGRRRGCEVEPTTSVRHLHPPGSEKGERKNGFTFHEGGRGRGMIATPGVPKAHQGNKKGKKKAVGVDPPIAKGGRYISKRKKVRVTSVSSNTRHHTDR